MSNLEKWIRAILNEDAGNLSIGSVRTLQMIKHEFERLQKENADHVQKFSDLLKLIDRYNKSTGQTGCGNHVNNEIVEHLANKNLLS